MPSAVHRTICWLRRTVIGFGGSGFELQFANELSPMAANTFAANLLGVELEDGPDEAGSVFWLRSKYSRDGEYSKELLANPNAESEGSYSDLDTIKNTGSLPPRSLLVGSILELNRRLTDPSLPTNILPKESVELVAGGPPCQSFSMAGLRQHDNSRNSLPWAFAEFVKQPTKTSSPRKCYGDSACLSDRGWPKARVV